MNHAKATAAKRIEAWGVVGVYGVYGLAFRSRALAEQQIVFLRRALCSGGPWKVAHLIERDPAEAAELRRLKKIELAAVAWRLAWGNDPHGHAELDLAAAVESLKRAKR
jgi:hypothetical protein